MSRIGLVGYGQMGAAMAPILVKDGHAVLAVDVDIARTALAERARHAAPTKDEAFNAEIVVLALPGPAEVESISHGRFQRGQLVIDTTSIDPTTAAKVASDLESRGAIYVEAPILGGPPQVGDWSFLFGGSEGAIGRARPILARLGSGERFGPVGKGSEAKLLNNILTAVHAAVVAEVLRLAERQGTDVAMLQRVITASQSAGRNPVLEIRVPKLLDGTLTDTFSIDNMTKDLALALELPATDAARPSLADAAFALFSTARDRGWGARDIGCLAAALNSRVSI